MTSPTGARSPEPAAVFRARVVRVIDGDTAVFDVDLRFHIELRVTARLYGINAPELRGATREAGEAARAGLVEMLDAHSFRDRAEPYVVVKSHKGDESQDKYGRWLFEILGADGDRHVNLNEEMIRRGLAVSYLP